MSDYEAQRQRHVAGALALAPRLIEQLNWPADRLAEHRTLRLRELVRIATERSPWYRKRLSGVDIDRLDESALAELPVLTKTELMEHFDDIVTDSRLTLAGLEQHLKAPSRPAVTCSAGTPRSPPAGRRGSGACSSTAGMPGRCSG